MSQKLTSSSSRNESDFCSEVSIMREHGGFGSHTEHKKISITLKSNNESIDDLLKKMEGVF